MKIVSTETRARRMHSRSFEVTREDGRIVGMIHVHKCADIPCLIEIIPFAIKFTAWDMPRSMDVIRTFWEVYEVAGGLPGLKKLRHLFNSTEGLLNAEDRWISHALKQGEFKNE